MTKSKVFLLGSKKDGFVIQVQNSEHCYKDDIAITGDELETLRKLIDKKLK